MLGIRYKELGSEDARERTLSMSHEINIGILALRGISKKILSPQKMQ